MNYLENKRNENERKGSIEVICGSMFSGKTEELIRRLRRAQFANLSIKIFKPAIDTRYSVIDIVSHDQNTICSIPVEKASEILKHANGTNVVGIDEAQFFDNEIITVCSQLANSGTRVIIAGLDIDFKGIPFGPMPYLCAIAEDVFKTRAICVRCGSLAYISHRLIDDHSQIRLGEKNLYEPLCRTCNNDSINQKPSSTC